MNLLDEARKYLIAFLKEEQSEHTSKHSWRNGWEFAALHSLRVEAYVVKILQQEKHALSESEVQELRLAAILHDIARMRDRRHHAQMGAKIARVWLQTHSDLLAEHEIERITEMIADHSNKENPEADFSKAVLKDADLLDEIGVMSIFMASNWLEPKTPFFFHQLQQRLVHFELPFCDQEASTVNTHGAREMLKGKRLFIEGFIAQLADELQTDETLEQLMPELRQVEADARAALP